MVLDYYSLDRRVAGREGPLRTAPNRSAIPSLRELAPAGQFAAFGWSLTVH